MKRGGPTGGGPRASFGVTPMALAGGGTGAGSAIVATSAATGTGIVVSGALGATLRDGGVTRAQQSGVRASGCPWTEADSLPEQQHADAITRSIIRQK